MDTLVVKLKNQYLTFITKHTKTLGKKVDNETHSKVKERKKKKKAYCHTLISPRDDRLPTFGSLLAELNCLTLIVVQSVEFCDVSEGNVQNIQMKGKMITFGTFFSPCAH